MAVEVIERQLTESWYELSGDVAANELFPTLLPNSGSIKKMEQEVRTESEFDDRDFDGYSHDDLMEDEIEEFTQSALSEFHDEAFTAAKNWLTALQAGQTLLHGDFEEPEEDILEEAATALDMTIPWDPAEAAQMAANQAAYQIRLQEERELQELRAKKTAEVLENARQLFKSGNSHAAVRAMFPEFSTAIATLVGVLRKEGVQIAAH